MGLVDDESDAEADDDTIVSLADEEAYLANGKESPVLNHTRRTSATSNPRTPTTKDNDLLNITRLRRKGITETEEIWEELEDDTIGELSPFSMRRGSVWSASSRPTSKDQQNDPPPDESTALLARSSTGRSYRDKRRRHSTQTVGTQERDSRRKSVSSQEALGGWWKMKRWWSGNDGKGKDREDNGHGNGNGNGV